MPAEVRHPWWRLSRLVWRDAAVRYWRAFALVLAAYLYLERAWPLPEVRSKLWSLDSRHLGMVVLGATAVYVAGSRGPARQLVASARLEYWLQFPIPPRSWSMFTAVHLAMLHLPVGIVTGYMMLPAGPAVAAMVAVATTIELAGLSIVNVDRKRRPKSSRPKGAHSRRRQRSFAWVAGARPPLAITSWWWRAAWRRRPGICVTLVAAQVVICGLAMLAVDALQHDEAELQPTVAGFVALATVTTPVALTVARRLAERDAWFVASLPLRADHFSAAVVVFSLITGCVPAIATIVIAASTPGVRADGLLGSVLATTVWVGLASFAIDQRIGPRASSSRRVGAAALVLLAHGGLAMSPWWSLVAWPLAWDVAQRRVCRAQAFAHRFEPPPQMDDHDR